MDAGNDAEVGQVYVCSVCGWTGEGEPPDECRLCRVKKERFVVLQAQVQSGAMGLAFGDGTKGQASWNGQAAMR